MAARVFLAVEGRHDGGALGRSLSVRDNDPQNEGALQPLLRRLIPNDDIVLRGQKTAGMFLTDIPAPEDARGRRALRASMLAAADGCDVLVLHCDVDDGGNESDPQAAWNECAKAIESGFETAQGGLTRDRCIAALPCRTIEAWLLADIAAIADRASPDAPEDDVTISDPEALWGANQAGTSHPKQVFQRAMGGARRPRASVRDYRAVAESSSLETLATRCPISFEPFQTALRRAFASV